MDIIEELKQMEKDGEYIDNHRERYTRRQVLDIINYYENK
jgi:hypothetical protein